MTLEAASQLSNCRTLHVCFYSKEGRETGTKHIIHSQAFQERFVCFFHTKMSQQQFLLVSQAKNDIIRLLEDSYDWTFGPSVLFDIAVRAFTKPNQQKTPSRFLKVTLAKMEFLTMANPLVTGGFVKDIHQMLACVIIMETAETLGCFVYVSAGTTLQCW